MSRNSRRISVVVLALLVAVPALWLDEGHAQKFAEKKVETPLPVPPSTVPPPGRGGARLNPDGFLNNGIHLVKDEKRRGDLIEAAVDYINDENWATAIENLQKLLMIEEDVFVRLKRKNAEGNEIYVWVSAKQEADRLIGSLPKDGKDLYEITYREKAAGLLKKAKKNGDPGLLNEIMKKYAHTKAGAEAIKLLGDYKFDRGEYMPALLCYSKLINRLGEDKVSTAILAKAAWAAHLAPPSSSGKYIVSSSNVPSEKELWKMLRARTREIQLGEQAVPVEDLQEYVAKLDRRHLEQNATDALIYRATPSRNNQLVGGPAFLSREWGYPLVYEKADAASTVGQHIREAKKQLNTQKQPIIPAFSPIALTAVDHKGEKKSLLIYKNFFGVFARDLRKKGELAWISPSNGSLQRMLESKGSKQTTMTQWLGYFQAQQPQILFENSTVGTLSTDGQFVYVVEDLAVPPTPTSNVNNGRFFPGGMPTPPSLDKELEDAVSHNRLYALSLARSGALTWALGDASSDDEKAKDPFRDHYFLGPPLPLAGKLYILADKQQEIRLLCLETVERRGSKGERIYTPRVVSTQTLGMTQEKMQDDPLRRTWAAHLAYGEGILVCPTNTGAVFGVNLLENSLVWAYPYRDKNEAGAQPGGRIMPFRGRIPQGWQLKEDGMLHQSVAQQAQWKVTAPVISDGKVVFAAPDANSIHCINLRDGSPVWNPKPKLDDDLYLGTVYNGKVLIVGKKNVRALSLATGETLWTLETGLPSGQGIGSDNVYYLPLAQAAKGKEPQILGIDMDQGKILSSSKVRSNADVPGNLLFAEGKVISVTAYGPKEEGEVVAYPQLKVKLAEMDDRIVKNPNDPGALTERGELRLDKGDLSGAIDDLSTALKNNPGKELRAKARAKLYDTLTVYIADHFNDAEQYLKDYEELCKIDVDGVPESERGKLEAEQRRRRATYLWLVGKGREEQGRLVEAFEKYQEFAQAAGKQSELVPAVDDRQVKAAPDVWSRGRIIAMMNNAKAENRQPLEKLIADKWSKLRQTNDLKELRAFVRMFGSVSDAGKEARLELVERLMEQEDIGDEHPLLEAELELNQLRTGKHSPVLAARATEALARLYTRKGLLEDAAYCYRKLGREYADIVIRDGKTGRQIYDDDAATDKRLIPYLDDPQPLSSVKKFKASRKEGVYPTPAEGRVFQLVHSGEPLPFFRHHIVGLNFNGHRFTLMDRNLEDDKQSPKVMWSTQLSSTYFETLSGQVLGQQRQINRGFRGGMMMIQTNHNSHSRFPYETVGHLVILPLANRVFGIDPVHHRLLWEKDLSKEASGPFPVDHSGQLTWNQQVPVVPDPTDGTMLVTYNNGWAQRLGQVSPFQGQTICVQSPKTLNALDPITGRTLWSRMDVNPRNFLFSDEDYVFVVELDNQNQPNSTRVFRATDGIKVKAPDFAALFAKRLQVFGRYLLLSETGSTNSVVLRLYDMVSGQDVWKQSFAPRSIVSRSEDATLAGVVEPSGKVHVIDLKARKEVMTGEIQEPGEHLKGVQRFTLLADRDNFYFAPQPAEQNGAVQMPNNVMTQWGMRSVPVHGVIQSFARASGELRWYYPVKDTPMYLLLDRFEDLPIIFLTVRTQQMPGMAMVKNPGVKVMTIQKRDSRLLFNETLPWNTPLFFGIRVDPRARTVELLNQQLKITHYPDPDAAKKTEPAAAAPKPKAVPTSISLPQRKETRVNRPAFDRAQIREIAPPPPG
ncbi:MAG TPA: PQQ-binding-like beta-propeller repeat protein [Gemmataceae bacterium]|nr:PQQ-binding-like beta-propeller repeat protein [Gemmataceae bacterium]